MTLAGLRVPLPTGLVTGDGERVVDAVIRPLTGRDEERLAAWGGASMAATVTALLSRCVVKLGDDAPTAEALRALSVGDREALLLHLRRATLGDRIDCVATCSDATCGERLDLTLSVDALLVEPTTPSVTWHEESFPPAHGAAVHVRFRLPTGGDQEATAEGAAVDATAAARSILGRCIASVSGASGDLVELPDEVADAIASRMAALDPQAEIRLRFDCAACGRQVDVLFDTAAFFFAELGATADRLYDEVHAIAWHYHWSEDEILGLPRDRRRRYLDFIASSLAPRHARGVA